MSRVIGVKDESITFTERLAVRLILLNDEGKIALIHAKKDDYYKLPGGGIEADEDHLVAAAREAQEETGCIVEVDKACLATTEVRHTFD